VAEEQQIIPNLAPFTIDGLQVDESIFSHGFVQYCDISKCGGGCCHSGVYLDTNEYKRILEHKQEIARVMDDSQDTDPATWFDNEWIDDPDFPSGRATGTSVHDRDGGISGFTEGCVFLDRRHFCSVQVAAAENGLHRWAWKPKYCILFPITVVEGMITYDDSHSDDLNHCGPQGTANYVHSVFEAMQEEIGYCFGEEALAKMKEHFEANRERFEADRLKQSLIQINV
jgi:Fe-S-cluster containining protein